MQLILVGGAENNYLSLLETTIKRLQLDKRINFIGYVAQEGDDLPLLYNGAECFVYPSFSEGWTSPPLEAMACGRPVIAPDVSGCAEAVEDGKTGLLIPQGDPEALSCAILEILRDSKRAAEMGLEGRSSAEKNFSVSKMVDATESLYFLLTPH